MTLDLSNLTPAPWHNVGNELYYGPGHKAWHQQISGEVNAEFIALARNAFDVLARREWSLVKEKGGWCCMSKDNGKSYDQSVCDRCYSDPFTSLVEADKWIKAHCEEKSCLNEKT